MNGLTRRKFLSTTACTASGMLLGTGAIAHAAGHRAGRADTPATPITRVLGRTGLRLPVVSMGVMRSDNPGLVRAALKAGIVHFDTAHGYQGGRNEEMLGTVFADYPRESFVVATKVKPEDGEGMGARKRWLGRVDMSLSRLAMEYVDILYLHAVGSPEETLSPTMLEAVQEAKESGRARFVGVSTHKNEPDVIDAAVESGVYDVVLTAVNFKQDHYTSIRAAIERAAKAGVGIVGMKTMAGAFLDKARTKPINCKAALKFVLQNEHVSTTIPGITSYPHLEENASVNFDLTLTEEERDALAAARPESGLYCQSCGQCTAGCPHGLPIPDFMRAYMYAHGYRDLALAQELLRNVSDRVQLCTDCGSCVASCVKGFSVVERIADVRRVLDIPADFLA